MHIEFLVEEPSMEIALKILVPKIVGSQHTFCIHNFHVKKKLLKQLKDHGYQGLFKTQFAQQVAPHVDIDNNRSTSFQHFRDGLRMLINHNQKYLIAPRTKYGGMARPSLCVIEAKRDDFEEGWAQALAAMVASSLLDAKLCYGVVTTGKTWEFGKLEDNVFTLDPISISATDNLQKIFNIINWMFDKISKPV